MMLGPFPVECGSDDRRLCAEIGSVARDTAGPESLSGSGSPFAVLWIGPSRFSSERRTISRTTGSACLGITASGRAGTPSRARS